MRLSLEKLTRTCVLARAFAPAVLLGGAVLILALAPAIAQNAEVLRRDAKACEQPDGFMRALAPDARGAVDTINAQRRRVYEQRATEEKVELAAAAQIYALEISKRPDYRPCPR
jgi:uncharacterized protein